MDQAIIKDDAATPNPLADTLVAIVAYLEAERQAHIQEHNGKPYDPETLQRSCSNRLLMGNAGIGFARSKAG